MSELEVRSDRTDGLRLGKRQRHALEGSMDCSDTASDARAISKHVQCEYCDGALLCLPLQLKSNDVTTHQLAVELARCLHEPKQKLLKEMVEVLGAERTVEFFTKTAETQRKGGVLTADGDKKRAPGGVFFSLVKGSVTETERKQIFAKDSRLAAKKAKQVKETRRKKKWKEDQERKKRKVQDKAQKQLDQFRKELGGGLSGNVEHPPDRNMERRWKRVGQEKSKMEYTDLDDPTETDDGELTEGWRNDFDDHDDFATHVRVYEELREKSSHTGNVKFDEEGTGGVLVGCGDRAMGGVGSGVSLEEKRAAERFERTDECEFGIDFEL